MVSIAVCDDDREYINDVERHISQYFAENGLSYSLFTTQNGNELVESDTEFDIAFLDIEMPQIDGINLGKQLLKKNPDIVLIYITAYNHYLDEAMDLGVARFFDKPINSDRFYKGLEKAITRVDNTEIKFYLKDKSQGVAAVRSRDIIFVEIKSRKVKVITRNGEYESHDNIKTWRQKLNKSYFIIPHNSFIVNTNYITYYSKDRITLCEKYSIPIAYSKRAEFKRRFLMLLGE